MIAVDTNILIYAHREEMPLHAAAKARLIALAEGDALWAIPVFCIGEFVRVITHPRLFDPPFTAREAFEALDRILSSPSLEVLHPGTRFLSLFSKAVQEGDAVGNLAFDAQIVALCREHGVRVLLSEDRDFHRFPKFTVEHLTTQ